MCPEKEIQLREENKLLHIFEMEKGTEKDKLPRASPGHVVKIYSRPAAGKLDPVAADLRPAPR